MDRVVDVREVVAREIADYVALGAHGEETYFLRDDARRVYSFVSVPRSRPQKSAVIMLARITDDNKVIIETDITDKPLYETLIQSGIPRTQIIRAYAGKTEPEP